MKHWVGCRSSLTTTHSQMKLIGIDTSFVKRTKASQRRDSIARRIAPGTKFGVRPSPAKGDISVISPLQGWDDCVATDPARCAGLSNAAPSELGQTVFTCVDANG